MNPGSVVPASLAAAPAAVPDPSRPSPKGPGFASLVESVRVNELASGSKPSWPAASAPAGYGAARAVSAVTHGGKATPDPAPLPCADLSCGHSPLLTILVGRRRRHRTQTVRQRSHAVGAPVAKPPRCFTWTPSHAAPTRVMVRTSRLLGAVRLEPEEPFSLPTGTITTDTPARRSTRLGASGVEDASGAAASPPTRAHPSMVLTALTTGTAEMAGLGHSPLPGVATSPLSVPNASMDAVNRSDPTTATVPPSWSIRLVERSPGSQGFELRSPTLEDPIRVTLDNVHQTVHLALPHEWVAVADELRVHPEPFLEALFPSGFSLRDLRIRIIHPAAARDRNDGAAKEPPHSGNGSFGRRRRAP